jgi:hypothetical protein
MSSSMCFGSGALAERDGDVEPAVGREVVHPAVLVELPVHGRRVRVELLHPVHADVARARLRILGDDRRQGDEGRRVVGPAVLDRQEIEIYVVGLQHDLLGGAAADRLRHRVGDRLQLLQALDLLDQALRGLHLEDGLELCGRIVEPLDAEREAHAPLRAELVDEQRVRRALGVLEEQSRPACLDGAVDDLRDLEVGIDLSLGAGKLAFLLEQANPVPEISRRPHRVRQFMNVLVRRAAAAVVAEVHVRLAEEREADEDQARDQHPEDHLLALGRRICEPDG